MSFPRYPHYKPSGVEWLGEVPEHWEMKRVKRIASIRYGIGEPPRYYEEGTPLIRATNVNAGTLCPEGLVFVDPREIPEQRIVWLTAGDIIIVRSGAYTGDSAIIPHGLGPAIAGFDMILKCYAAHAPFIQFALLSKYLKQGQLDLEKMRAAQPHLNAEELGSCVVVLPNLQEQNSISAFLMNETAKIDALVAEQQRLIELLKEKRQAVISHAVTKGLDPTVPMKPSGIEWLGDVPAGWTVTNLKRVGGIRYGIGEPPKYYDEGTPLIRATNVHTGEIFSEGLVFVDPIEIPEKRIVWLEAGDIIVVRSGAYTGDSAIIPVGYGPCIAGFDMVLKCHSANPEFVQFALLSKYLKDGQIDLQKMRAAQPHLNAEELGSCFFLLPPAKEQDTIVQFLADELAKFDTLTAEAQRAIDLMQERRTALISAAVTGQIDVRQLAQGVAA